METDTPEMLGGLYPYLHSLAPESDPLLQEMEEFGRRRRFPVIGPLVGALLQQIALMTNARRVVELGSGFGYSAAWFLRAHPELRVVCTDGSPLNAKRATDFLGRLGVADRVDFRVGDALELVRDEPDGIDVVLADIDKSAYVDAFELMLPKLRRGGVFIADNALWRGYAWTDPSETTPEFRRRPIEKLREFNRLIHRTDGVATTLLPFRDGIAVCVRR